MPHMPDLLRAVAWRYLVLPVPLRGTNCHHIAGRQTGGRRRERFRKLTQVSLWGSPCSNPGPAASNLCSEPVRCAAGELCVHATACLPGRAETGREQSGGGQPAESQIQGPGAGSGDGEWPPLRSISIFLMHNPVQPPGPV